MSGLACLPLADHRRRVADRGSAASRRVGGPRRTTDAVLRGKGVLRGSSREDRGATAH